MPQIVSSSEEALLSVENRTCARGCGRSCARRSAGRGGKWGERGARSVPVVSYRDGVAPDTSHLTTDTVSCVNPNDSRPISTQRKANAQSYNTSQGKHRLHEQQRYHRIVHPKSLPHRTDAMVCCGCLLSLW